jgi:hypothetical protein
MLRIDELIYEDSRITDLRTNLKFPHDCGKAPGGPGVCLVVCPEGTSAAIASENLQHLITQPSITDGFQWVWHVTGELGLPLRGSLHFFSTASLIDAENLMADVLEEVDSRSLPKCG